MAINKFRPALEDCQQAAILQSAYPSPKTLIRLARCQLVVDSPTATLSTIFSVLSIEPSNEAALQLRKEALELDAHLIAETVKDKGNKAFEAEKFNDAIEFYTEAISKYYSPQALQCTIDILRRTTAQSSVPHESSCILHGHQEIPTSFGRLSTSCGPPIRLSLV